jgi:hypothetical protein
VIAQGIMLRDREGLLDELRQLEVALHRAAVRSDPLKLDALLHPDFWEVGSSGTVWSRAEILAEFAGQPPRYAVWAQDFVAESVAPGVALLSYRSAHVGEAGSLSRHTRRLFIWLFSGTVWKLRFHQATPTEPFKKHEC